MLFILNFTTLCVLLKREFEVTIIVFNIERGPKC